MGAQRRRRQPTQCEGSKEIVEGFSLSFSEPLAENAWRYLNRQLFNFLEMLSQVFLNMRIEQVIFHSGIFMIVF
jgi:hypothetical protein